MDTRKNKKLFSVLVFEDDLEQHYIIKKILEKEGFQTKFVTTSDSGLELLKTEKFDAVLMDYQLASGSSHDGIGALKEIRKKNVSIPVLMMTAYGTQELAIEAIKGQSDDFLIKPLDYSSLGKILTDVIRKRREIFPQENDFVDKTAIPTNLNVFSNFIILKDSIPIYIKGEWSKNTDRSVVQSSSTIEDQLLMSSFLSAMQTLSKSLFGQNVNELALGQHKIVFKQKNELLSGIKVNKIDFKFFYEHNSLKNIIFSTLETILTYLEKEKANSGGEIIRLANDQRNKIEEIMLDGFEAIKYQILEFTK